MPHARDCEVHLKSWYVIKLIGGGTMQTHADCRMYEQKYPEVDDVVMVQVKSIAEMGAYVSLLEYYGIEGMILLSELSRRRIRSITKLIKVGWRRMHLKWPGNGEDSGNLT